MLNELLISVMDLTLPILLESTYIVSVPTKVIIIESFSFGFVHLHLFFSTDVVSYTFALITHILYI